VVSVTLIIESVEAGRGAIHITTNVEVSTLCADVFAHAGDGLINLFAFGVFASRRHVDVHEVKRREMFARRGDTDHLYSAGRCWPRRDSEC
jgi:hypothetical protein